MVLAQQLAVLRFKCPHKDSSLCVCVVVVGVVVVDAMVLCKVVFVEQCLVAFQSLCSPLLHDQNC